MNESEYIDEVFGPSGFLAQKFAGYEPRKAQIEIVRAIDESLTNEKNILIEAPCGCHAKGQGILMYNGQIKLVEDIVVGDRLMGPDSTPRTVLALMRGEQEMVDIVPIKGTRWRVNLDHVLTLVRMDTGNVVDVSVRDWIGWSKNQKNLHKLFRSAASFPPTDEPQLDPYFLGVILGDGSIGHCSVSVTKPDPEIRAICEEQALKYGLRVRYAPRSHYHLTGAVGNKRHPIITRLRSYGLFPCACDKKFVPHVYKTGTREVRLQALAGLLDTDGHLDEQGSCFDFISKSKQLSSDVAFIARSVGLAATINECRKGCQNGFVGTYFRVCISGNTETIPTRIPRKKAKPRRINKNPLRVGFAVERTDSVEPFFGFTLNGDGRYLLDDFTVTHNSGKGLSYLVPTIRHSLESGASRVLVVTANNALSEQLIKKDLPTLRDVLPWQFEFALAKGKSNFLCLSQFDHADRTLLRVLPSSREQLERIDEWAAQTQTGDLSELPFEPSAEMKRRLTVQSDECMGRKCDRFDSCFVEAAKRRLETAKVIVTNYHLFFADRMIRRLTDDESGVLPNVDIVIFDEADRAPSIARGFYGFELSRGQIVDASRLLVGDRKEEIPEIDQDLKIRIEELSKTFFDELAAHAKSKEYKARLRSPDVVMWRMLDEAIKEMARKYSAASGNADLDKSRKEKLRKKSLKCYKLASDLREAMELANENFAYFVKVDDKDRATLCGSPIDVAELLERDVWKNDEYRSVIGTSATLTTDGDFDWIKGELGAHEAEELSVESPFDIRSNMLVVVPEGIPLPNERNFQDEASRILCDAIDLARGRTLGLFTSHRGLKSAAYFVNQRHGRKYEILVQNAAPRTQLVQRKRDVSSSVLLGTESFWTGVDVQGEALSLVFIDKLPFPTPDDPILDVLAERDPKGHWMKNCLPRALIAFKQGIGRLLRTTTDRGVVVICDSRIVDKPYGKAFLKACGGARVLRNLHDIASFLDEPEKWKREVKTKTKKAAPKETIRVPRGARVR